MVDLSSALSAIMLQQQVQLSVTSKVMDVQQQNASQLIDMMETVQPALDPTRGQLFDVSV